MNKFVIIGVLIIAFAVTGCSMKTNNLKRPTHESSQAGPPGTPENNLPD